MSGGPVARLAKVGANNALRVATVARPSAVASVSVLVGGGARHERDLEARGATHVLSRLALQGAGGQRTALRLNREAELMGASLRAQPSREALIFEGACTSDRVDEVVALLADILQPRLEGWQVRDTSADCVEEAERKLGLRYEWDTLHDEAFRHRGLANSPYSPATVGNVSEEHLRGLVGELYTQDNIVVVGSGGIDHDKFVQEVNRHFEHFNTGKAATEASPYRGGDVRSADLGPARLLVAFEGASRNAADAPALAVLGAALGFGESRNYRGPGLGSSGILNKLVRASDESGGEWLSSLSAFNVGYSDTGLFGVKASAVGPIDRLAETTIGALRSALSLSDADINRAKGVAKHDVAWDSSDAVLGDIATTVGESLVLGGAEPRGPTEIAAAIDAVTADQVRKVAERVLRSRVTVASFGDVRDAPTREDIEAAIAKK